MDSDFWATKVAELQLLMEFQVQIQDSKKISPFLKMIEDKYGKIDIQSIPTIPPKISKKKRSYLSSFKFKKNKDNPKVISEKVYENDREQNLFGGFNCRRNESWANKLGWWEPSPSWLPVEFCTDTSLHGLKYIGQPKRHLAERIFWLVAFLSGLILAIVLISGVWRKYNDSPVIVSFQSSETSVDQIPFPAVTICNMNKILKSKANEFMRKAQNGHSDSETKAALQDVYYLEHVCSVSKSFTKKFNYSYGRGEVDPSLLQPIGNTRGFSGGITDFLRKASQNCSDMLPLCVWQDEIQPCQHIFRAIETDFGSCCTFNFVPQTLLHRYRNDSRDNPEEVRQWEEWNFDAGGPFLKKDQKEQRFPRRQMQAGKTFGLSFALNPNLQEYFCTTSDSVGFRLQVHLPIDVAHVSDFGVGIKPNSEVFVEIKPEITVAEKQIFDFPLIKRQCYYSGEYTLKYYSYYSSSNCVDECIANATYNECQCVRYYMPRDDSKELCGPQNFTCAEETKRQLIEKGVKNSCSLCLPTCTEMSYTTDTTTTPLQEEFNIWEGIGGGFAPWYSSNVSIVHIYFGSDSTYARVRKELFGSTDLFANTGGLMGLCLGFSGLSLMEVIYFITLRAWCRSRRKSHLRSMVARKFQEIWRKTKEMLKMKSGNTENSGTNANYSNENIIPGNNAHFITTVSINDEFTRNALIGVEYKPQNGNLVSNMRNTRTIDYKNVFGEVQKFYKNN